jgi:hypothetical protein
MGESDEAPPSDARCKWTTRPPRRRAENVDARLVQSVDATPSALLCIRCAARYAPPSTISSSPCTDLLSAPRGTAGELEAVPQSAYDHRTWGGQMDCRKELWCAAERLSVAVLIWRH